MKKTLLTQTIQGLIFFIFLILSSCKTRVSKEDELKNAYLSNNRGPFIEYLEYLAHNSDSNDFFWNLLNVQHACNFEFGYVDPEDIKSDTTIRREEVMKNIVAVYKIYLNSDLFKNKTITSEDLRFIQDKYFKWDSYSDKDLKRIKFVMDSIAFLKSSVQPPRTFHN